MMRATASRITRIVRRTYASHGVSGLATLGRYYWARGRALLAGAGRECTICGWQGRDFRPLMLLDDAYVRSSVSCPGCGSWERQRAFAPALAARLASLAAERPLDILHVSPEECLAPIVATRARSYLASNFVDPQPGQMRLDLQDLALPAESLDVVVMSYVLCCVPNDRLAAANLWRALRPGGVVLACEPFTASGATDERRSRGGEQRRYGAGDVAGRFAPLSVDCEPLVDALTAQQRRRYGVRQGERMLVLRRGIPSAP